MTEQSLFSNPAINHIHYLKVFAPATIANFSVGFDALGLAVAPINGELLGDIISISDHLDPQASHIQQLSLPFYLSSTNIVDDSTITSYPIDFSYQAIGKNAQALPTDLESNLVYKAFLLFKQKLEHLVVDQKTTGSIIEHERAKFYLRPQIHLTLEKNMPIGSGLGSSSCSAVASLYALNQFHGNPLSPNQMLELMGELEGSVSGSIHYDNVAPSYLGGLQLISPNGKEHAYGLPLFKDWYYVLAYPGIVVKTEDARRILPDSYSKATAISHAGNIANFVHALHIGDQDLALAHLKDELAEPFREQLLPNMPVVKAGLKELGALASGISGSGPTYFAVAKDLASAQAIEAFFREQYLQNDLGFVYICQLDQTGARIIDSDSADISLDDPTNALVHSQSN